VPLGGGVRPAAASSLKHSPPPTVGSKSSCRGLRQQSGIAFPPKSGGQPFSSIRTGALVQSIKIQRARAYKGGTCPGNRAGERSDVWRSLWLCRS